MCRPAISKVPLRPGATIQRTMDIKSKSSDARSAGVENARRRFGGRLGRDIEAVWRISAFCFARRWAPGSIAARSSRRLRTAIVRAPLLTIYICIFVFFRGSLSTAIATSDSRPSGASRSGGKKGRKPFRSHAIYRTGESGRHCQNRDRDSKSTNGALPSSSCSQANTVIIAPGRSFYLAAQ
jgi:hypothetical protein